MTITEFEDLSLFLGIGGLMLYMLFVIYKLARESRAGRFGTLILFIGLGLGVFGFAAKSILQMMIEV